MASELAALFDSHSAIAPQYKVVRQPKTPNPKPTEEKIDDKLIDPLDKQSERREAKTKRISRQPDPREDRTVFVGGLPISYTRKQVKYLLKQYGAVESVRLRSMLVDTGKLPANVARKTHKQLAGTTVNAYVVFEHQEDAEKALALNGTLLEERHLRVDKAERNGPHKHQCSVFLGNLPFTVDEEAVRGQFSDCGDIESVRLVRDSKSGVGKGFGFVTFTDRSGVLFALKKNGKAKLEGRSLRVLKSKENAAKSSPGTSQGKPSPSSRGRTKPKLSAGDGKQFLRPGQRKPRNSIGTERPGKQFERPKKQSERPKKPVQTSTGTNLQKFKYQKGHGKVHKSKTDTCTLKQSQTGPKRKPKSIN